MAADYKYNVVGILKVHDGDTVNLTIDLGFHLNNNLTIRMAGINAPELPTPAGVASRDALIAYIVSFGGGSTGWTAQTFKDGREKYGRWLATLFAPDGTNVNQMMVEKGWAQKA